ncbi:MAG: pyrroline-5-carboxylate reductase, partial [Alphaproteobacteria bacterium]|nr:pyrroline-5-carboxylate reductase [Alphaproteobacteria bacterium]
MTTTNNPFLDNLSRLMTDAAGMATGMKREAETVMRAQFERLIRDMDV